MLKFINYLKIENKTPIKSLAILFHGYGSNSQDMLEMANVLKLQLPSTYFISANAPDKHELGGDGFQWFSLYDWATTGRFNDNEINIGLEEIIPSINDFIDKQLLRLGLTNNNLVLIGFSQGTMLALRLSLLREKQIAAVVAFSGALLLPHRLKGKIKSYPDIHMIHGEDDDVVPLKRMEIAAKALKMYGVNVKLYPQPKLGHSINEKGIKICTNVIKEVSSRK